VVPEKRVREVPRRSGRPNSRTEGPLAPAVSKKRGGKGIVSADREGKEGERGQGGIREQKLGRVLQNTARRRVHMLEAVACSVRRAGGEKKMVITS